MGSGAPPPVQPGQTTPERLPGRRFIPTLGGMDFSPVIFILLVQGIDIFLRPLLFGWIIQHTLVRGTHQLRGNDLHV